METRLNIRDRRPPRPEDPGRSKSSNIGDPGERVAGREMTAAETGVITPPLGRALALVAGRPLPGGQAGSRTADTGGGTGSLPEDGPEARATAASMMTGTPIQARQMHFQF